MKTIYRLAAFLLLLAPAVLAQEHYTEGPVWRVSLIRVKPTQMDAYLTSLRQSSKHKKRMERSWITNCSSKRPRTIPKIGTSASQSNTRITLPWTVWLRKEK